MGEKTHLDQFEKVPQKTLIFKDDQFCWGLHLYTSVIVQLLFAEEENNF